jgi:5-methyltetrahydropteroyltriglutamate--homocysteine methyltransferase
MRDRLTPLQCARHPNQNVEYHRCHRPVNVRHEHGGKSSETSSGKVLVPGVVSHATNVVEHPEVVADRILNFAKVVGRESVIAGTDCGLGGRIHPQLVWAKLTALVEDAKLATEELYGS